MDNNFVDLSEKIAETFTQDTIELLKTQLFSQKKLIKEIYDQLNSITAINGKIDKSYTVLIQNAYRVIMAAREYFTGENIGYRIYYASSNSELSFSKPVSIYNLNEEDILNLTTLEGTALRLKSTFTEALKEKEHNQEREAIFEKHWNDVFNQLKKSKYTKQTTYYVIKPTYLKYYKQNPSLTHSSGRYATFNRGNLYEAFDATSQDVYSEIENIKESIDSLYNEKYIHFEQKYFGQYLKHDQVKGFQTGDVGLIQIKARRAQLIEIGTLKKYLRDILNILDTSNNSINGIKLKQKIKELFTDPEINNVDEVLEKHIDKIIEDLVLKINKT